MKKRIMDFILYIWKDPVWSKVISAGIIGACLFLWAIVSYETFIDIISYKIPVYLYLLICVLLYLIYLIAKEAKQIENPIWKEQVGNYTFKELYTILATKDLPVPTIGMKYSNVQPPNHNIIELFLHSTIYLNRGISLDDDINDGGYLHGVLAPYLAGFGLVIATPTTIRSTNVPTTKYQMSDVGHKFYSLLERLQL
ncbi:MAG: hypothetical protein WBP41_21025 [Saprospiraceae bacterium]